MMVPPYIWNFPRFSQRPEVFSVQNFARGRWKGRQKQPVIGCALE